jgi:transcriptional regulator with XRE-family HTH domain
LTGAQELTAALKRCLKSRGMTYAKLARELQLSEASVKRLFAGGGFTLKRVEHICRVLDIDLYELARLAHGETAAVNELSAAQEQALADEPKLLVVFHLLLNDWRPQEICAEYQLSTAECTRLLAALDRSRLIDLLPGGQVRLRTARQLTWRQGGPIRRAYQSSVLGEFFAGGFDAAGVVLRFEAKELSPASRAVMRRKLERLAHEFNELAQIDAALPARERESVGLVVALRPFVASLFTQMKRRRASARAVGSRSRR